MTDSKSLRMMKMRDAVGQAIHDYACGCDHNPWPLTPNYEQMADAVLTALGLNDMDGFVRRLHEGYFDDAGPSAVEYACMRNAVEFAFSATPESENTDG